MSHTSRFRPGEAETDSKDDFLRSSRPGRGRAGNTCEANHADRDRQTDVHARVRRTVWMALFQSGSGGGFLV